MLATNNRDESLWINFKYEKLGQVCFDCGKLDHTVNGCILTANDKRIRNDSSWRSRPWLRASHYGMKLTHKKDR